MSSDHGSTPSAVPAVAAARFHRNGETVFNLALRITGSPGASWYATVAAFAAVTERIPADAAPGLDDRDLLLMGCWHARGLLRQIAASPEYAAQLHAHDQAALAAAPPRPAVAAGNDRLPVDQREVLALRGLSDLDHAELSGLLRVDPGLLATMLAQSRLMLRDALRGGTLSATALEDPEDRHALALAALRQDGLLRGAEGRERLSSWLESNPAHRETVEALEEIGLSYAAWTPTPTPAGLLEAVVAAASAVEPAAPTGRAPEPGPDAAAEQPTPDAPSAGTPSGASPQAASPRPAAPQAPAGGGGATRMPGAGGAAAGPAPAQSGGSPASTDPNATVEWSSSDVAALGLEGAGGRAPAPAAARAEDDEDFDDDGWDGGEPSGELLQPLDHDRAGRAPRWMIALVVILLIAVIGALILTLNGGDDPTEPTPTPTTTKRTSTKRTTTSGAVPASRVVASADGARVTVRVVAG